MSKDYKLLKARCLLLTRKPWYGHAAASMRWVAEPAIETMAVSVQPDGYAVCRYAPQFLKACTVGELAAVVEHEIEHVLRRHCHRSSGFEPVLFNIACDMVINGRQSQPQIGVANARTGEVEIPFSDSIAWLPEHWPLNLTAEQVYRQLLADKSMQTKYRKLQQLDRHDCWATVEPAAMDNAIQRLASAALNAGVRPPQRIETLLPASENIIPWQRLMRRFIATASGSGKRLDRNRRSRRVDLFGMPGRRLEAKKCQISVVVDISGSISDALLAQFFGELETLLHLTAFSVLTWSNEIGVFLDRYAKDDWRKLGRNGSVGTDMVAPVLWLRDCGKLGDATVMLTDGYCDWPPRTRAPLLVVCSSSKGLVDEPSHGQTIYLATTS